MDEFAEAAATIQAIMDSIPAYRPEPDPDFWGRYQGDRVRPIHRLT
jgi:hypothetical protein